MLFLEKRLPFSFSIHFKWLHYFNVGALSTRACQQDKVLFLGIPVSTLPLAKCFAVADGAMLPHTSPCIRLSQNLSVLIWNHRMPSGKC